MHSFTSLNSSFDQDEPAVSIVKNRNRFARLGFLSRKRSKGSDGVQIIRSEQGFSPVGPLSQQQNQSDLDLDTINVQVTHSATDIPLLDVSFDGRFDSSNEMSPEETLNDIKHFEKTTIQLQPEKIELKRTLFPDVQDEPITPPKLMKVSLCDIEVDMDSTPRTKNNAQGIADNNESHSDASTQFKSSAFPTLDELIGAAKDVVGIFNVKPDSNNPGTTTESHVKAEGIVHKESTNCSVKLVKKPLKAGASFNCEAETDVEMLLKTPTRCERRTVLIVGKSQNIICSIATPKRPSTAFEKPNPINDIFDDLDDSPDRAIRFSNCNFQVISKSDRLATKVGSVFNPFEDSMSEDKVENVEEDCEEYQYHLVTEKDDSRNVSAVLCEDVWFSPQNQEDMFSPIDWALTPSDQKHSRSLQSYADTRTKTAVSPEDLLKKFEEAKTIIAALKGLGITRKNERKEIYNNENKRNDFESQVTVSSTMQPAEQRASNFKNKVIQAATESSVAVTQLAARSTPKSILNKDNFVSPTGVSSFPTSYLTESSTTSNEIDTIPLKSTEAFRSKLIDKHDYIPEGTMQSTSVKERIHFFELQHKIK